MGLAASQSRLLMLTARQSDVESSLMRIANEKLSLSRQSSVNSEKYSEALSARTLTWDTSDGSTAALTYDMLMTPNTENASGQYMITDQNGAVMLNDTYADLIGGSGVNSGNKSGNIAEAQFLQSVMKLTGDAGLKTANNYITDYKKSTTSTGTDLTTMTTAVSNVLSYALDVADTNNEAKVNYVDNIKPLETALKTLSTEIDAELREKTGLTKADMDTFDWNTLTYTTGEAKTDVNGFAVDAQTTAAIHCTSDTTMDSSYQVTTKFAEVNSTDSSSEIASLILMKRNVIAVQTLLSLYAENNSNNAYSELNAAISMLFTGGTSAGKTGCSNEVANILATGNDEQMNASDNDHAVSTNANESVDNFTAIGGTNLGGANSFLDYNYDGVWATTKCGAIPYKPNAGSTFTPNCLESLFNNYSSQRTEDEANQTVSLTDTDKADYYINLWTAINEQGWVRCSAMDSKNDPSGKALQNLILNGGAYLYKLQSDLSWAVTSTSDVGTPINNVSDDARITAAEAEYTAEKDQLDYKESNLDIQSNDLDTERAALTTEAESVQKIIDANVKKFKMFDA